VSQQIANDLLDRSVPDLGFRSFRLAQSNFPVWRSYSGVSVSDLENHINEIAYFSSDEATSFDCLIEVLIKLGFSLNVPLKIIENEVFEAYLVGEGDFIAVVGSKKAAELEDFATLLNLKPSRFLVMEDSYQGSDELKTNLEQECSNRQIELIKK
jgi:adenine-specific DNA-methyltransferase